MFETSFFTKADTEKTFRLIASGQGMELFRGSSLVPGIKNVEIQNGQILVQDSWGFYHRESLVQVRRPSTLVFHISPNPLLRLFLRGAAEEWSISKSGNGSVVQRRFSLLPQKWAGWALPFLEKQLRRAVQRNNETLAFYLLLREAEPPQKPLV